MWGFFRIKCRYLLQIFSLSLRPRGAILSWENKSRKISPKLLSVWKGTSPVSEQTLKQHISFSKLSFTQHCVSWWGESIFSVTEHPLNVPPLMEETSISRSCTACFPLRWNNRAFECSSVCLFPLNEVLHLSLYVQPLQSCGNESCRNEEQASADSHQVWKQL